MAGEVCVMTTKTTCDICGAEMEPAIDGKGTRYYRSETGAPVLEVLAVVRKGFNDSPADTWDVCPGCICRILNNDVTHKFPFDFTP